jgi:hypothetical protein
LQRRMGLSNATVECNRRMQPSNATVEDGSSPNRRLVSAGAEQGFDAVEVFFGVNADGVEVGGFNVDVDAVFEEAELFEALGLFECAGGEGGKTLERVPSIGVEADVLPVLRGDVVAGLCVVGAPVAIIGDGGAGEVESAAVGGGDNFDGVWVGDVFEGAENLEGGDFDVRLGEGAEEGSDVLGFEERLVALDVDVDIGGEMLGDGVDAVGSAAEIGRGELDGPVVAIAEFDDFFGVSGDDDAVELRAGAGCLVDPGEHGPAGDGAKDFAGETRGGEARRNDAENSGRRQ